MRRVHVVGKQTPWTRFAVESVRRAGKHIDHLDDHEIQSIESDDLVVLTPGERDEPSAAIGPLLARIGPVRIVVMDSRQDYLRAGDALRACAVGYEMAPWNQNELLRLLEEYTEAVPPEVDAIERRFGQWRAAAV